MRLLPTPIDPPAAEPVAVADCKVDARIDGTEFDAVIPAYIAAAREMCEQETGACLITQVRRAESIGWPAVDEIIAISPASAVAVTYWDGSAWATLDSSLYEMSQAAGGVVIEPTPGATWPTLPDRAGPRVRIDITCGYGDAAAVPTSLKLWIRAHVVAYLNDPAALITGTIVTINPRLSGLLDPHRVYAR